MSQNPIEIILTRQLAEYLTAPIIVVNEHGGVVFFNELAQKLLGRNYNESGDLTIDDLTVAFKVTDLDGRPLTTAELPVGIALREHKPSHRSFRIEYPDGTTRQIEVTAFPLVGQGKRLLGAVTIFWDGELP